MTTDELKGILDTIVVSIQTIKADYTPELSSSIENFLGSVTPENVKLLATVFQLDEDTVNNNIASALKIAKGLDTFFLTDESDKILAFCQRLENNSLMMKFLAWYLG